MTASSTIDNRDRLDTPPPYDPPSLNGESPNARESVTQPTTMIFEENEFGEMRPTSAQATSTSLPDHRVGNASETVYAENEFGEIHREATDPDLQPQDQLPTSNFGKDTADRSEAFRSDEVYAENRFGELGRADTYVTEQHSSLTDKLKEKAEHIIDKLTVHHKGDTLKADDHD